MLMIHLPAGQPLPTPDSRGVAFVASFAIHAALIVSVILITSDVRLDPAFNKPGEGMPGQSARTPYVLRAGNVHFVVDTNLRDGVARHGVVLDRSLTHALDRTPQ